MIRIADSLPNAKGPTKPAPKKRPMPKPLLKVGDYRLENDPRFLQRVEQARKSLRAGRGTRLEDL